MESFHLPPRFVTLPASIHSELPTKVAHPSFCVQSLGFDYMGVVDGIITQVGEFNLLTPLLPEGQADISELKDPTLSLQGWLFWHGQLPHWDHRCGCLHPESSS